MNDAQVEEIKRHFGVVAEALRSDIRQVAEGHSGIRHELREMRDEFRDEVKEMLLVDPSRSASHSYSFARARLTEKPNTDVFRAMTTPP